jgi:hypothetical protein
MPLLEPTATNVIRALLEHLISTFVVIENIDSDNGIHFVANVLKGL